MSSVFEKNSSRLPGVLMVGIVVLIALALGYPWYSYKVNSYLFGEDLKAVAKEVQAATVKAQRQAALAAQRRRVAQVKVTGVAEMPQPVVIANMATASLNESRSTLCRQASLWLKRPLNGTTIRVQRYLGSKPAQDIGRLTC